MSTENRSPVSSTSEMFEAASRNTLALNPLVGIRGQDLVDSAGTLFKAIVNEPKVAAEQWFSFLGELGSIVYCHCESCRKAQGTAFVANAPVAEKDFVVTSGAELVAWGRDRD